MRNVAFLTQEMEPANQPGIDTVDPRFIHITDLVEKGEFENAAEEIELLHEQNIFDIRLIGYYLYQVFLEEGLGALGDLAGGIDTMIDRNWQAIGPGKKRKLYVNRSLNWLFHKVSDDMEYHRTKTSDTWVGWRDTESETYGTALVQCGRLANTLAGDDYNQAGEALARLTRELREIRDTAATTDEPAVVEEPPQPEAPPPSRVSSTTDGAKEVTALSRSQEKVSLKVSHSFIELCLKLKAFETLVAKRDFEKAALVSDDVMSIIDGFDPRRHFPELFASFSGQMSTNVQELAPYWDRRDSIEWKTLQQFYEVDLDSFVGE